jgi:transposase
MAGKNSLKKKMGNVLSGDERSQLMKRRKENKQLRMEKEILKKAKVISQEK